MMFNIIFIYRLYIVNRPGPLNKNIYCSKAQTYYILMCVWVCVCVYVCVRDRFGFLGNIFQQMTALHVVMLENVEQIILHSDSNFFMVLILSSKSTVLRAVPPVCH